MTTSVLLGLVIQYGPSIIPLIQKLIADIEAGKGNAVVSAADLAALSAMANQTSADIYKRLGITPPA
jgi:hypothetical protein